MIPYGSPAAGDDDVGIDRLLEGLEHCIEPVRHRADALDRTDERRCQGSEHCAVAGRDLVRQAGVGVLRKFIAAVDHGKVQGAADGQFLRPGSESQRQLRRADACSGRQDSIACTEIHPGGADVAVGRGGQGARQADCVAITRHVFLQDHGSGTIGQGGSRGDAHRLSGCRRAGEGMARGALPDYPPRAGQIIDPHGIAIHGGQIAGGLGAPGKQGCGEVAPKGLSGRALFQRQWCRKFKQPSLRLLQRQRRHLHSAACQWPDLPPRFSISRMPSIAMPLSMALAMS